MAKKKSVRRSGKKTWSAKKKSAKKTATRPKPVKKKSATRASNSVDSILNRYKKERASQESQLDAVRKRIDDMKAKVRSFQEQIAKLNEQESATMRRIDELDAQRDQEVGQVLARLGVQVNAVTPAAVPAPGHNLSATTGEDSEFADER